MVVGKPEHLDLADDSELVHFFQRVRCDNDTVIGSSWALTNNATKKTISQVSNLTGVEKR